MPSPLLVGFEQRLSVLEGFFIMRRPDYNQYTTEDFTKAVAYRLLASAALEDFVERRCLEVAAAGCDRLTKSQPTATGRSLVMWSRVQDRWAPASSWFIHEIDAVADLSLAAPALALYTKHVKKSHGISGDDIRGLVYPLGLRESQVSEVLLNSLGALADKRNPASHTYVKSQAEPEAEVKLLDQILIPLRQLDSDLDVVKDTFPVSHL